MPDTGEEISTQTTINAAFNVHNANGAPAFDVCINAPWNLLEGQALQVNVFAFDPNNAGFEPKIRLSPNALTATAGDSISSGPDTTVSYQVTGLPSDPGL